MGTIFAEQRPCPQMQREIDLYTAGMVETLKNNFASFDSDSWLVVMFGSIGVAEFENLIFLREEQDFATYLAASDLHAAGPGFSVHRAFELCILSYSLENSQGIYIWIYTILIQFFVRKKNSFRCYVHPFKSILFNFEKTSIGCNPRKSAFAFSFS